MSNQPSLIPNNSILTNSADEGRRLAVILARLSLETIPMDSGEKDQSHPIHANESALLIAMSQTIAIEFATIAAANNYWR